MFFRKWNKGFILFLSAVIVVFLAVKEAESELILSSDLTLHFACPSSHDHDLERAAVKFLKDAEFRVINEGKILRDHGSGVFDIYIIAMDNEKRSIEILSLPPRSKSYMLNFITKPPTIRDRQFEKKLEDFIKTTDDCEITQVTKNENGADKAANFEKYIVDRFNTLQAEVDQLDPNGNTPR